MNPKKQINPYQSPWSFWSQVLLIVWRITWFFCCSWTPKFFNPWRLWVLKLFGCKISGVPFVHSSAKIQIPWHIKLHHRACLGENVFAYSLGTIEVEEGATVAQESYLCTGTHDFTNPNMQLITKPITIKKNAFLGVRSMILPNIVVGENSVVGAQEVVTKNIPANEIYAGNPAQKIGERKILNEAKLN